MMEWFQDKFITPLCHYYTLEATFVYGVILILAGLATYKLIQKLGIRIDKEFFYALLPFIMYGGWARALTDHSVGIYQGWWWCSPPIYFIVFAIALLSLIAGFSIQKKFKISYHKTMIVIGSALLLYNIYLTQITNFLAVSIIVALVALWSALLFGAHKLYPKKMSLENAGILIAHLFDGSSTFTALTFFNYYEQHVLPSFLIDIFGPWVMFPLKIIVVYAVLYILDTETENAQLRNFMKIIVLILGLALGTRDFLTLAML